MASKKIITVFGATGAQGGGLVRSILKDPNSEFSVRAVTRNPDSDKAKELSKLGAELVKADIDDTPTVQRALDGAYGAYFVTLTGFSGTFCSSLEKGEGKKQRGAWHNFMRNVAAVRMTGLRIRGDLGAEQLEVMTLV
jgi:hypothetical protein